MYILPITSPQQWMNSSRVNTKTKSKRNKRLKEKNTPALAKANGDQPNAEGDNCHRVRFPLPYHPTQLHACSRPLQLTSLLRPGGRR